jgi:hypothetical protein
VMPSRLRTRRTRGPAKILDSAIVISFYKIRGHATLQDLQIYSAIM